MCSQCAPTRRQANPLTLSSPLAGQMAASQVWRLKRYGRFVPSSAATGGKPWKVFEANDSKPEIFLTIVESGYLLVLQGEESLDTIPLLCGSGSLKVHQKSDNLMFRFTVQGESRVIRLQFDGSSRADAVKECSSAVEKLTEYMPVTTQDDAPPLHNQPPAEVSAPVRQVEPFQFRNLAGKGFGS
ncbi:meiotic recombination protein REC114 isoform X4 [Xiphias gladius]|uniref:meiotic recombination protein REC114 isoform X4 n=1 Tax=Xiphias gladius TaxID=8245 RepID=UPI001A99B38B|nr:meiotic recombination protein REC114 isoform X4 [Xiphias gladius]